MAGKVSIQLEEQEILELEAILQDGDQAAALAFLRRAVWHKVKAASRKLINPKTGGG